ncbi:MAG: hypothetical protein ABI488_18615 [Polyangiaceae bacterium]
MAHGAWWGVVTAACVLASCGGRASSEPTGSSSVQGGAPSTLGGAPGVAGSVVVSGGGAAAAPTGGSSSPGAGAASASDAGPPVCNDSCPAVICPSGEALQYLSALCCPVCESCNAPDQACPPSYECGSAARSEIPKGQCCANCVANDQAACDTQTSAYGTGGAALAQQYSAPCQKDADCGSAVVDNPCQQGCVYGLTNQVAAYAAALSQLGQSCSACPLFPPLTGGCSTAPVCNSGTCTDAFNLAK